MKIEQLTEDLYTELVLAFSKRVVDEAAIKKCLSDALFNEYEEGYVDGINDSNMIGD